MVGAQAPPSIGPGHGTLFGGIRAGAQSTNNGSNTDQPSPKKKRASTRYRKAESGSDDDYAALSSVQPTIDWSSKSLQEKVARVIELQAFDGSWSGSDSEVIDILGVAAGDGKVDSQVWITLLVVKWLEIMAREEEGVWEMVVEKARGWLTGCGVMDVESLEIEAGKEIEGLK